MSNDGMVFGFASDDSHVVPGDYNGIRDVFVTYDCDYNPVRATVSSEGQEAIPFEDEREYAGDPCRFYCVRPQISPDGNIVAYTTWASNLDPPDENAWPDVFVHDLSTGATKAISRTPAGDTANGPSYLSDWAGEGLSSDGSRIAFLSFATDLVTDYIPECPAEELQYLPPSYDLKACYEAYLYDEASGIQLVSKNSDGRVSSRGIDEVTLSGNGAYVFFNTDAPEFFADVEYDPVPGVHIYRKEIATGRIEVVALSMNETPAQGHHYEFTASDDGQRVAFLSSASDLVPGDTNGVPDLFIRDMRLDKTWRASVNAFGEEVSADLGHTGISPDGRFAFFITRTDGLVPGDSNGIPDVFLVDLEVQQKESHAGPLQEDRSVPASGVFVVILTALGFIVAHRTSRRFFPPQ